MDESQNSTNGNTFYAEEFIRLQNGRKNSLQISWSGMGMFL